MSNAQQPDAPAPTCPVKMTDALPCGRPIYHAPGSADPNPPCIMHCREATKDPVQFRQEIDAILTGTSAHHRHKDKLDFTGFVCLEADFSDATFTQEAYFSNATFAQEANFSRATFAQEAYFSRATFTQDANFIGATFTQNARFYSAAFTQDANFISATFTQNANFIGATLVQDANFIGATLVQDANFSHATFTQDADFSSATFTQNADFSSATFTQTAGFRWTEFRQPELVRFYRVNQKEGAPGLRARFVNCRVEGVQFADVRWHRQGGRMVLQDELDLTGPAPRPAHELVASAYRQLVNNFEKERAYDLAEDCKIGAMEMKRLDPKNFLFANWLEAYYERWRWLRWLGENVSVASLYRLTSHYGTSYTRALLVLLGLLILFALLFALPWSAIERDKPSVAPQPVLGVLHRLVAGLFHSLEVAAFQRDSLYGVPTRFGRLASILETILVPAQLALFLLALRRRFRH